MADIETSSVGGTTTLQRQQQQQQQDDNNNNSHQNPRRYQAWVGLFVFSVVALTAQVSAPVSSSETRSSTEKWVLSVLSISLSLSFLGVVGHYINKTATTTTTVEGILASVLVILWVAGIPSIMKPTNCMALCGPGVYNTNLYFSSWAALACSLYIWGHYGHYELVVARNDNESNDNANNDNSGETTTTTTTTSPRPSRIKTPTMWYALLVTSIVLLTSSVQYHTSYCIGDSGTTLTTTCTRNSWAMSLGCISCLVSAIMSLFLSYYSSSSQRQRNNNNNNTSIMLQLLGTSTLLSILYTFGIAFLTFGNSGPGIMIGNLYFSTWIGFVLSILITFDALQEYYSVRKRNATRRESQQQLLQQQQREVNNDNDVDSSSSRPDVSNEQAKEDDDNNNDDNSTGSRTMIEEEKKDIETGRNTDVMNNENRKKPGSSSLPADPPAANEV